MEWLKTITYPFTELFKAVSNLAKPDERATIITGKTPRLTIVGRNTRAEFDELNPDSSHK